MVCRNSVCKREPDRQIEDHADHRGGDRRQRAREPLVAAQRLDEGRAEEDPEEAGDEGDPGRQQSAERGRQHRRQRAGIAIGGHEADELQHHDQRARRGLGHAEAVEHLARLQPVIMLDRLLGDIGQHRIGAAERHHRHLGEEQRDLAEHVGLPEPDQERGDRHQPQQQPDRAYASARAPTLGRTWSGNSSPSRLSTRGRLLVAAAVLDARRIPAVRSRAEIADHAGRDDDDREGDVEKEDRDEGDRRERDHHPVAQRALADADHGLRPRSRAPRPSARRTAPRRSRHCR